MMRKLIAMLLAVTLLAGLCLTASAAPTANYASIAIGETLTGPDGKELGAAFVDGNSRTLVPLRALANMLGLTVNWDGNTMTASFTDGTTTVAFKQNEKSFTKNGQAVTMDTATVNKGGRVYAPARYLAEAFGYTVGWDAATRTVKIHRNAAKVTVTKKSGDVKPSDITLKTYQYKNEYAQYDIVVLTNHSNSGCSMSIEAVYYDAAGLPVDTSSDSITAFAPHTSAAIYNMPDKDYASASYKITLEETHYSLTTQHLTTTYNVARGEGVFDDTNVIGIVKNNGTEQAKYVEFMALFYQNGELKDMDWGYVTDTNIEPGSESVFKADTSVEFDSVEIYLDSRGEYRHKW